MLAAEVIAVALKKAPVKRPRIVWDNGSQFIAKEWREVIWHVELEEIPSGLGIPSPMTG